uniref:hypothetical protein n=1 Tax=Aeromonas sp. Ne-1 TaxID=1675689 RepID=UPI00156645C1|nr:hypothetical protein [Aeromonas sp. Ne-1]
MFTLKSTESYIKNEILRLTDSPTGSWSLPIIDKLINQTNENINKIMSNPDSKNYDPKKVIDHAIFLTIDSYH